MWLQFQNKVTNLDFFRQLSVKENTIIGIPIVKRGDDYREVIIATFDDEILARRAFRDVVLPCISQERKIGYLDDFVKRMSEGK